MHARRVDTFIPFSFDMHHAYAFSTENANHLNGANGARAEIMISLTKTYVRESVRDPNVIGTQMRFRSLTKSSPHAARNFAKTSFHR